jgi:hypothetical protein
MYVAEVDWLVATGVTSLTSRLPDELSAATAMALTVSVTATVIGPAYMGELVVGVAPLVV